MRHAIDSRIKRLDAYFAQINRPDVEGDIKSSLVKHGAILVCGYVERSVEVVILDRLRGRAQERVIQFVKSHFKRGTNYDCEAIRQLLERFDQQWADKFQVFVDQNDAVREALTSIYAVRNSIAHGGDQSLGENRLKELYMHSRQAIEALIVSTS